MGYGGWKLYFDPLLIRAVVDLAATLSPDDYLQKSWLQFSTLISELTRHESDEPVFPGITEPWTGQFRESELPAKISKTKSGWVKCPFCDKRFMLSDPRRWDGKRHLTCGQKIIIQSA
jgi:hypothetical protein